MDAPLIKKPLLFMGSSRRDLKAMPEEVQRMIGYALFLAQIGRKHPKSKPFKGYGGAGVLEVVEDHDGSTFRAVYTVDFPSAVYVLHAFQKKSKRGVATPKPDLELIRARYKAAQALHEQQGG